MNILVIEDDKQIANTLKKGFENEGFIAAIANDGEEGYQMAVDGDFDAIVLDIMLPSKTGLEICSSLRKEKNYVPVIMLTARDSMEDKVLGLETGADDYLIKPFSFGELLARVKSLIRRSTIKTPIYTMDNLVLDPNKRVVTRNNVEIRLTAKEYYLLEYLMSHPDQVLMRDQIIAHVWDYNYDTFSNPVDVFMKRLRNKIEGAFPKQKKLIHTVRGLGYKFGL